MSARGRYLFAVATGLDASQLGEQCGLDGAPLELVEHDGLQAVVCDVDLDEFGEEPVRRNLEQLAWVERVARTHDAVVRAVAARATVAPMRLVTVCLGDDSVVRRLREWEQPLRAALSRVEGCHEWSVKVYWHLRDDAGADNGEGADRGAGEDREASGTAYLMRRREQLRRRQDGERAGVAAAEAIHVAVSGRSRASRLLAPQDPQLTGRTEPMLLNGTYLFTTADEPELHQLVDGLRAEHPDALIEVGGPWAPYSFAVLEPAGGQVAGAR